MEAKENIEEVLKSLPIYEFKEKIVSLVRDNLFCVITGETGSGKSTQISQYLLDAAVKYKKPDCAYAEQTKDWLAKRAPGVSFTDDRIRCGYRFRVVVTQPRRVAAIQMAKRVAFERNCALGEEVGYTVRFDDVSNIDTHIKYVTDGILVRECLLDCDLNQYSVVILDEAHERSLNTDILFALVKQAVLRRRGTLRLVVTSATLRTDKIAAYYFNCPTMSVSGRCYSVSILHKESSRDRRMENAVGAAIRIHLNEPAGDVLVFLTGFEECEQATKLCFTKLQEMQQAGKDVPPMILCPLYGAQSPEQ